MPLTFAHPAAAVPLARPLGRHASLVALIIGSMTPDFAYFMPVPRWIPSSHSPQGLLTFCLPMGVLVYLLFQAALREPLRDLLPAELAQRVPPRAKVPWLAVPVSILAGAITHLAWDSLTHGNGQVVQAWPLLREPVFTLGGLPLRGYKLLQHLSTLLGLGLLTWWTWRWQQRTPVLRDATALTSGQRWLRIGTMVALALPLAWLLADHQRHAHGTYSVALRFIYTSISLLGLTLTLYGLGWQAHRRIFRARSGI